jgi:transposase
MKGVDTIARIRREFFIRGRSIKEIVRELHVSRNTVRKVLRSGATSLTYERDVQPRPKLGPWRADLDRLLLTNAGKPARERLTLMRIFEVLRGLGYEGGYDAVRRYARRWRRERQAVTADAYVPLTFAPGEAYQFDWSHEVVLINGTTVKIKVAHVRLCHSRMLFVRAYPRESQEMVFDAHDRAFAFFKGACQRGIYDNMKTAVEAIFVGRERAYNRRFLQMCSHYLVDPVACTPASGWEKGQVENQVGLVRERFFTPRVRVKSYAELNTLLLDQCIAYAKAQPHPDNGIAPSGRCSRPSGQRSCPMQVPSTASTPCRLPCRRPAWSASTTTATRSRPMPLAGRSRSAPTRSASRCARTGAWWASMPVSSGAIRPCSTPGITCRCWPASRGHSGTGLPSRTGCCPQLLIGSGANSPAPMTAIARWS